MPFRWFVAILARECAGRRLQNNMRASSDRSVQPYNSRSQTLAFEWYLRALRGGALNEPQYPARNGFCPLMFAFQTLGRLSGSPISKSLYGYRDTQPITAAA